MTSPQVVDVAFPLSGAELPLDHGYVLFGALSRLVPRLHEEKAWGVHPVHGLRTAPGVLRLGRSSLLTVRLPASSIAGILPLAGATLEVVGKPISLGVPRIYALRPNGALRARFVTIKSFDADPGEFGGAVRRQLDALGVSPAAAVNVGERRVLRVSAHTIVGFPVDLTCLSDDESVRIQEVGVGGRRHMGAGLFLPRTKS